MAQSFKYTLVPGIFIQDDPNYTPSQNQLEPDFGLIGGTWPDVDALNADVPAGTTYKLLFAGRHGQGFHNVGEEKYGEKEWKKYWSKRDGDGEITWGPDALLTDTGIQQARNVAAAWAKYTGPRPTSYYASPFRRTLRTFQLTFAETPTTAEGHPIAMVREGLREHMTERTCDVRVPVSEGIAFGSEFEKEHKVYNWIEMESTGVDPDPFAKSLEDKPQVEVRASRMLNLLFATEKASVVSWTTHHSFIVSMGKVLGRDADSLPTGGVAPFLIKAEVMA